VYAMYLYYLYIKDTWVFPPVIDLFIHDILPTLSEETLENLEHTLFSIAPSSAIPQLFQELLVM
jgi:hypothetical protein